VSANAKDCPSADDLRKGIAAQLGRDDFDRPGAPHVTVHIRPRDDVSSVLVADVSMTTQDGATSTRTIGHADTCSDLVRAAALSIALAIERESEAAKPAPPPTAPEVPSPTREEPSESRESLRSDRFVGTAAALTSIGLLPRPAAGIGAALRGRITESVWISARGFWLPEAAMPNDAFAMNLVAAGPGVCFEPFGSANVTAVGCGHVFGGAFGVTTVNALMQSRAPEAYVAASLSAGARARIAGPLQLEGAVDGQIPFTRPTYLTQACPITGFEPPFAALALWLGVGASL
jgi:hypothetical protein